MSRRHWILVVTVALLAGWLGMEARIQWLVWQTRGTNVDLIMQVLQYNIARGHLEPLPGPAGPASPPPPPAKAP